VKSAGRNVGFTLRFQNTFPRYVRKLDLLDAQLLHNSSSFSPETDISKPSTRALSDYQEIGHFFFFLKKLPATEIRHITRRERIIIDALFAVVVRPLHRH
jgi:hypothetical protein